jgi:hypothetical protein
MSYVRVTTICRDPTSILFQIQHDQRTGLRSACRDSRGSVEAHQLHVIAGSWRRDGTPVTRYRLLSWTYGFERQHRRQSTRGHVSGCSHWALDRVEAP